MRDLSLAVPEHSMLALLWVGSLLVYVLGDRNPKLREVARLLFLAASIAILTRAF